MADIKTRNGRSNLDSTAKPVKLSTIVVWKPVLGLALRKRSYSDRSEMMSGWREVSTDFAATPAPQEGHVEVLCVLSGVADGGIAPTADLDHAENFQNWECGE